MGCHELGFELSSIIGHAIAYSCLGKALQIIFNKKGARASNRE